MAIVGFVLSAWACSGSSEPEGPPLTDKPYTTLQALWNPLVPPPATQAMLDAGELSSFDHPLFDSLGLGVELGPGNPWLEHGELAPDFAEGGPGERRSLLYFWQVADPQLMDEESPIRFEAFVYLYRPNGHYSPQVFASQVATARRISERSGRPFDFALAAGDLTDGSQKNELNWTLTILEGGEVDPDSGLDDDPLPAPQVDYNDPFVSPGIGCPWYAAIGNHETLYNGGVGKITEELREAAAGRDLFVQGIFPNGFCDGSDPLAPVRTEGPTPADPERIPLYRAEVVEVLHDWPGEPSGHGLDAGNVRDHTAYYSAHPVPDRPFRLLVLDTSHSDPAGIGEGSNGYMSEEQFAWLERELEAAHAASELVILMSHHRPEDFSSESPISGSVLRDRLAESDELILHLTGHGHSNVKRLIPPTEGLGGHWQLMVASPVDYPTQSRIFEIVWEGNDYLSIYSTSLDHNSPTDSLAHRGRELAGANLHLGPATMGLDVAEYWQGDVDAQNLLLRVSVPQSVRARLDEFDWPRRIESVETLAKLEGP